MGGDDRFAPAQNIDLIAGNFRENFILELLGGDGNDTFTFTARRMPLLSVSLVDGGAGSDTAEIPGDREVIQVYAVGKTGPLGGTRTSGRLG